MAKLQSDIAISQEKKKKTRKANAEKQKRYREGMKAQGYRARLVWEKPLDDGWVRLQAPVLRKNTLDSVKNNPAMQEVLEVFCGAFIRCCEHKKIPKKTWMPVYNDIQVLLEPLFEKQ
jgi:hypothetical protein